MTVEVQKLQGLIMKNIIKVSNSRIVNVMVKKSNRKSLANSKLLGLKIVISN